MRDEPRYDVAVEILSHTTLRLSFLDQVETFNHHNATAIQANLDRAVFGYIKSSPISALLFIQTEGPDGLHKGLFALHYVTRESLTKCLSDHTVPRFGSL